MSEDCEAAELQPSVFYHWQRHLFEHGAQAFGESRSRAGTSREQELLAENERLKAKLARKDEVMFWLSVNETGGWVDDWRMAG